MAASSRTGGAHRELGFLRPHHVVSNTFLIYPHYQHEWIFKESSGSLQVVAGSSRTGGELGTGNWASAWETIHSGCREAKGATSSCYLPSATSCDYYWQFEYFLTLTSCNLKFTIHSGCREAKGATGSCYHLLAWMQLVPLVSPVTINYSLMVVSD